MNWSPSGDTRTATATAPAALPNIQVKPEPVFPIRTGGIIFDLSNDDDPDADSAAASTPSPVPPIIQANGPPVAPVPGNPQPPPATKWAPLATRAT